MKEREYKMEIYKEYEQKSKEVVSFLKRKGITVIALGLRGSSHFELKTKGSDLDFTAFVLPTLSNLFFKESTSQSKDVKVSETISVQTITVQALPLQMAKCSFNILEFFTKITYVAEDFKDTLEKLSDFLEKEEMVKIFTKSFYFLGFKQYKRFTKGVNEDVLKAQAKAVLYYRMLTELDESIPELYKKDSIPVEFKEEFLSIRLGKVSPKMEEIGKFYEEEKDKYIKIPSSTSHELLEEFQSIVSEYILSVIHKLV